MQDNSFELVPIPTLEQIGVRLNAPVPEGPPDILAGLLPRQGQLVIAGETNVGKTLVALEMVSTLVTGKPLWGSLQPSGGAGKVLYFLGEHYNAVVQRLWQKTQLPVTDNVFIVGPEQLNYDKYLVIGGKPNVTAINKFRRWAEGVDLIVFDPLSSFISGVDAENDNLQMRLLLDTMSLIAQTSGASCIVLAHQGKPTVDQFGREHARSKYAIRGASSLEDAATNIFYMGRGADGGRIFELKMRKYKGDSVDKFMLVRDKVTLVHTLL